MMMIHHRTPQLTTNDDNEDDTPIAGVDDMSMNLPMPRQDDDDKDKAVNVELQAQDKDNGSKQVLQGKRGTLKKNTDS